MQKQHYEYYTPIIEWAEEKGILETGRLTKQLLKSSEECLELQTAIESYENGNKEAIEEIKDAIGDIYVTLAISTRMRAKNPYIIFKLIKLTDYKLPMAVDYKYYIVELKRLDLSLYDTFISESITNLDLKIAKYVEFLDFIAKDYNLTLCECIEAAYNVISKRTGKMIDGSFVKEK
jgi:hypothetical protein|nr:MAG TPA: hypothetical protein [Caudoviricetes sp.]